MTLGPERSKKEKQEPSRRDVLLGGAAALAAGALPHEILAARHPIDPEREAADIEAVEIAEKMRDYQAFIAEKSYFIQSYLLERELFQQTFVDEFKILMAEYVRDTVARNKKEELNGLRVLIEQPEKISNWIIAETEARWGVSVDYIRRTTINSLLIVLSRLAREFWLRKEFQ